MAATRAPTRFNGGIDIDGVHFLVGSGVPGGTTPTDGAGVGSSYQDTSNGGQYSKKTAGSGTDKWIQAATEDAATWRAPVTAVDVTLRANVAAAVTAANVADTVDGATIASGSRVLLTNLTAGNENIYVVSGSTAAWVFTEDANSATDADAVLVQDGTVYAETKFVFDGTNWALSGGATVAEQGYIRTFVGKTAAGSETPTYSSTNVVTTATTLEAAIGALDAEVGVAVATPRSRTTGPIKDQAINLNIEAIDDAIGADVTANVRTNNPVVVTNTVLANIEVLDDAIGVTPTSTNIISASVAVNANLSTLDSTVSSATKSATSNAVTTITTVDSELVDTFQVVRWLVTAQSVGTPANNYSAVIMCCHDGSSGADAVNVSYTASNELIPNTLPTGLSFTVDLDGVTTSQVVRLRCVSTDSVNVKAVRMAL